MILIDMDKPKACFLCNFRRGTEFGRYEGNDPGHMCTVDWKRIGNGPYINTSYIREDCPIMQVTVKKGDNNMTEREAIANKITDMILNGAPVEEIKKAIDESIKIIDSEKSEG